MKTVLIAALMVLESGATMKKHHHQHRHHHSHGHHHASPDLNVTASLAQQGHQSEAFQSRDFFKHRNMLNEREHENVQMYDTLNDKLTDEQYIGQAIEINEKNDVKNNTLLQIKSNEKGPFDRDTNPFEQFRNGPGGGGSMGGGLSAGGPFDRNNNPFEQFRTPPTYGPVMTNTTTRKSSSTITTTTKTMTTGSTTITTSNFKSTKSKYVLTDGFEAVKCADEGQGCSCLGSIHFGKKADSFSAMHDDFVAIFDAREGARGYMTCDAATFNQTGGVSTGGHQCYCVREMAPTPLPPAQHCANDAGLEFCDCFGTVYYGQRKDKAGKDMSYAEMMKSGWTSLLSNGQLLCDQNSFDGDPAYGHEKQCFCDADPSYEPMPPVEHCADENDECICQGTVYYGLKDCPFDMVPIDFMEMQEFGFSSRTVEGSIGCNNFEFSDPHHGSKKQCFCEADQTPQVKRCSMQDGNCKCKNGNMYFGLVESEGKSPISFDEMMEAGNFAYKWDVNGEFGCNAHTFGSDPQPGKAKQCFCDDIGYEDLECIQEQLSYWTQTTQVQYLTTSISSSWSSSSTTYSSSTSYSRSSSSRIIEEETRYQQESEYQLRMQEEERSRLTREIEMSSSMTTTYMSGWEATYKQEEIEMTQAEMSAKEARIREETLRKEAEAADEKSKYSAQLAAQKAAAETARLEREAEFKRQKAEADAARIKKTKMKQEMLEKNKLAQMELQAIRTARQAKVRAEKQKMRLESQKLLEEYEANRAATEATRTQEALTKQLEEAMARQRELALERAAEKEEIREKKNLKMQKEWERKQKLAQEQEERQIAIEKARQLQLERIHNETIAQKEKEARFAEEKKQEEERLKAEEAATIKHQREIEAQQLRALRAQAIASTEADIKEAQELADKLSEEMEESRKLRQKLLDQKRELAAHVQEQKAAHEQLVADQEKAERELKLAKEILAKKKTFTQKLKTETYNFVQKMKTQMEKTRKAAEEQMARLRKEGEEARVKREAAAKASREADEKEHQASLESRKKLNKLQKEQHERELAEKKAEFEKTFKHLWGPGTTGLSIVYATFDTKEMADKVITEVYKDTMISQVTNYPGVLYEFKNETKLHIANPGLQVRTNDARVEMITSDDRIPELIETCIAVSQNDNLDIVVVQMTDVSPDYGKWVALQSMEQDQTDAYYNVDPFSEIKPVTDKKVKCKCDFCPCPMSAE